MKRQFNKELRQNTYRGPKISIGDKVIMTDQYKVPNNIIGLIWTVTCEPKYVKGKMCVTLKDYKGYYAVDGLRIVG